MRRRDHSRLNTVPAINPARAEFKLGIFPPDHHVPLAAPTLTPPATMK